MKRSAQCFVFLCLFFVQVAGPLDRQASCSETSATTVAAKAMPAEEKPGTRPYEMVWADRKPPRQPLVNFNSLKGWTVEGRDGATGNLFESQKQRVWESPVARLVYRGASPKSSIVLRPPEPIVIAGSVSAATVWVYGNNWSWSPDPKTPPVTVIVMLRDAAGKSRELTMASVRWKEWWLVHKVLPKEFLEGSKWQPDKEEKRPALLFDGIRITGCSNPDERELYFEDLCFFEETFKPLSFETRPKRGIDPFPGQDVGANRGAGRLPFPTREETILPENLATTYTVNCMGDRLAYQGSDVRIEYEVNPTSGPWWGPVRVTMNGKTIAHALVGAGPVFPGELQNVTLRSREQEKGELRAVWEGTLSGEKITVESRVRLWQKSLVVDWICRGGYATELSYGRIERIEKPELLFLPYLNYGGHHLNVLMSRGPAPFFASVWMDWYRSSGSAPYAEDKIEGGQVRLNGGVRYLPQTDGRRNDLFERVFVTFSPTFEETLPTIANPPAKRGKEAGSRLWQESWGPQDYQKEQERSKRLRAYGIEQLTQCNHEITWRDGGESFTFREKAAPGKGGDEALRRYVAAQRSLGWRSGLYTNYTDYAPVNEFWDPDMVMRRSDGNLVTAWARCYSPKALFAVEMDRKLAPLIQKKYGTNAAYTDVHTSVSPWDRTDYDARVPGAGTFAATYYAYGELLLHDQDVYDGHCWSEGNHQWLYAGLCAGNYGLAYSSLQLWNHPYLPHFDLLKMHPLSVDIGVPWTAQFFKGKEGWNKPENIVAGIDQFLAATIAYGHIGWLVEETHGIRQTCRSYYMMQPLQSRYAMEKPLEIRYGTDTGTVTSSEALVSGEWKKSRLYVRYPKGLEVWVNGNADAVWKVKQDGKERVLPPFGWLAVQGNSFFEASELRGGKRCDVVCSPTEIFLDGRGTVQECGGISTSGSLAVTALKKAEGISILAVEGVEGFALAEPREFSHRTGVRDAIGRLARADRISIRAFDADDRDLGSVAAQRIRNGWKISAHPSARRYEIQKPSGDRVPTGGQSGRGVD